MANEAKQKQRKPCEVVLDFLHVLKKETPLIPNAQLKWIRTKYSDAKKAFSGCNPDAPLNEEHPYIKLGVKEVVMPVVVYLVSTSQKVQEQIPLYITFLFQQHVFWDVPATEINPGVKGMTVQEYLAQELFTKIKETGLVNLQAARLVYANCQCLKEYLFVTKFETNIRLQIITELLSSYSRIYEAALDYKLGAEVSMYLHEMRNWLYSIVEKIENLADKNYYLLKARGEEDKHPPTSLHADTLYAIMTLLIGAFQGKKTETNNIFYNGLSLHIKLLSILLYRGGAILHDLLMSDNEVLLDSCLKTLTMCFKLVMTKKDAASYRNICVILRSLLRLSNTYSNGNTIRITKILKAVKEMLCDLIVMQYSYLRQQHIDEQYSESVFLEALNCFILLFLDPAIYKYWTTKEIPPCVVPENLYKEDDFKESYFKTAPLQMLLMYINYDLRGARETVKIVLALARDTRFVHYNVSAYKPVVEMYDTLPGNIHCGECFTQKYSLPYCEQELGGTKKLLELTSGYKIPVCAADSDFINLAQNFIDKTQNVEFSVSLTGNGFFVYISRQLIKNIGFYLNEGIESVNEGNVMTTFELFNIIQTISKIINGLNDGFKESTLVNISQRSILRMWYCEDATVDSVFKEAIVFSRVAAIKNIINKDPSEYKELLTEEELASIQAAIKANPEPADEHEDFPIFCDDCLRFKEYINIFDHLKKEEYYPNPLLPDPTELAQFIVSLADNNSSFSVLNGNNVGEFVSSFSIYSLQVLFEIAKYIAERRHWAQLIREAGKDDGSYIHTIVSCLRDILCIVVVPGEAQKIERIMEVFSHIYTYHYNKALEGSSVKRMHSDIVFTLAFAVIMLNTDLHSPNVEDATRMTLTSFICNTGTAVSEADVSEKDLTLIYNEVKTNQFTTLSTGGPKQKETLFDPPDWFSREGDYYAQHRNALDKYVKGNKVRFPLNRDVLYGFSYTLLLDTQKDLINVFSGALEISNWISYSSHLESKYPKSPAMSPTVNASVDKSGLLNSKFSTSTQSAYIPGSQTCSEEHMNSILENTMSACGGNYQFQHVNEVPLVACPELSLPNLTILPLITDSIILLSEIQANIILSQQAKSRLFVNGISTFDPGVGLSYLIQNTGFIFTMPSRESKKYRKEQGFRIIRDLRVTELCSLVELRMFLAENNVSRYLNQILKVIIESPQGYSFLYNISLFCSRLSMLYNNNYSEAKVTKGLMTESRLESQLKAIFPFNSITKLFQNLTGNINEYVNPDHTFCSFSKSFSQISIEEQLALQKHIMKKHPYVKQDILLYKIYSVKIRSYHDDIANIKNIVSTRQYENINDQLLIDKYIVIEKDEKSVDDSESLLACFNISASDTNFLTLTRLDGILMYWLRQALSPQNDKIRTGVMRSIITYLSAITQLSEVIFESPNSILECQLNLMITLNDMVQQLNDDNRMYITRNILNVLSFLPDYLRRMKAITHALNDLEFANVEEIEAFNKLISLKVEDEGNAEETRQGKSMILDILNNVLKIYRNTKDKFDERNLATELFYIFMSFEGLVMRIQEILYSFKIYNNSKAPDNVTLGFLEIMFNVLVMMEGIANEDIFGKHAYLLSSFSHVLRIIYTTLECHFTPQLQDTIHIIRLYALRILTCLFKRTVDRLSGLQLEMLTEETVAPFVDELNNSFKSFNRNDIKYPFELVELTKEFEHPQDEPYIALRCLVFMLQDLLSSLILTDSGKSIEDFYYLRGITSSCTVPFQPSFVLVLYDNTIQCYRYLMHALSQLDEEMANRINVMIIRCTFFPAFLLQIGSKNFSSLFSSVIMLREKGSQLLALKNDEKRNCILSLVFQLVFSDTDKRNICLFSEMVKLFEEVLKQVFRPHAETDNVELVVDGCHIFPLLLSRGRVFPSIVKSFGTSKRDLNELQNKCISDVFRNTANIINSASVIVSNLVSDYVDTLIEYENKMDKYTALLGDESLIGDTIRHSLWTIVEVVMTPIRQERAGWVMKICDRLTQFIMICSTKLTGTTKLTDTKRSNLGKYISLLNAMYAHVAEFNTREFRDTILGDMEIAIVTDINLIGYKICEGVFCEDKTTIGLLVDGLLYAISVYNVRYLKAFPEPIMRTTESNALECLGILEKIDWELIRRSKDGAGVNTVLDIITNGTPEMRAKVRTVLTAALLGKP